jgi:hypothetical protein
MSALHNPSEWLNGPGRQYMNALTLAMSVPSLVSCIVIKQPNLGSLQKKDPPVCYLEHGILGNGESHPSPTNT